MSYDLYFTAPPITYEQFKSYFIERVLYKLENHQAWYHNPITDAYFSFEFNDRPPDEEDDIDHWSLFTINLYRPHYFILEAEPEVSAFVQRFGCSIYDPQNSGMGNGPYTPEGLLHGWSHANEFGYSAILGRGNDTDTIHARPTAELEAIWRWNYLRESRSEAREDDIFIPRILFALIGGNLSTFCVWPDAISTLIPRVDYLWIPRKHLAPKRRFRHQLEDKCLIPFDVAMEAIGSYRTSGYELEAFELPCPVTPAALKGFVRGLQADTSSPVGIAASEVLNRELVEKYKQQADCVHLNIDLIPSQC